MTSPIADDLKKQACAILDEAVAKTNTEEPYYPVNGKLICGLITAALQAERERIAKHCDDNEASPAFIIADWPNC